LTFWPVSITLTDVREILPVAVLPYFVAGLCQIGTVLRDSAFHENQLGGILNYGLKGLGATVWTVQPVAIPTELPVPHQNVTILNYYYFWHCSPARAMASSSHKVS
jgi:hypothetical protein